MKRYILPLALAFVAACSPKLDRSVMPKPAPAPTIQLGEIQSFTLDNGLKVFVVQNDKLPRVSFSLQWDIDPIAEGPSAGTIDMAGALMGTGTTNRTKDQINEQVDFIGASLSSSASAVSGSCLSKHTSTLFDIFADVAMNPAFNQEEFDKAMTQMQANLAQSKDDPNSIASNVRSVLNYGKNHPYGELVTEETLENVQLAACQQYVNTFLRPNNAYLAIVGDISMEDAKKLVEEKMSAWEKGIVPTFQHEDPKANQEQHVAFVAKRGAAQSVINITKPIELAPGAEDLIKVDVMNGILGASSLSRLFANLRETYGFTYGAYSNVVEDELVGYFNAYASVRNEVTDSAIVQFFVEIEKIRQEPVTEKELKGVINNMTGNFARALENPGTVAQFAINIEKYNLPEDYYATYLKRLAEVSIADVQEMAIKYLDPNTMNILVVGYEEEVLPTLSQFGEPTVYDIYGNEASDLAPAPEGVTAQGVLQSYIKAIGGERAILAIKDYQTKAELKVQGMALAMNTTFKKPNLMKSETLMGETAVQTQVFDGTKAKISGMGGEQLLEGEEAAEVAVQAKMFPELAYEQMGVNMSLEGIKKMNGKDCYVIKLDGAGFNNVVEYYDVESGLKVATETDASSFIYKDYTEVEDVLFPFTTQLSAGGQQMELKVTSVEVNTGVSNTYFAID